jgi:hypothetical protein
MRSIHERRVVLLGFGIIAAAAGLAGLILALRLLGAI